MMQFTSRDIIKWHDVLLSLMLETPIRRFFSVYIWCLMNEQIGKNRNNKYRLHNASNRNGQHLIDFMIENRLSCLNTNFQKKEGKLWTYTYANKSKRLEKKLDGNYTRMLRAVLNKSWRQHPTRHQLYGHFPPPITKTIQARRTRHAGHCWRSKDELISDALLWTPTYGCAKAGRPARTYIQQLCEDTGCNPEDLPEAMNDREKWRERVRDIRAGGAT